MALYRWIVKHSLMTMAVVVWGVILTTWVTYRVFGDNPPEITAGTAAAYATLFVLPTLVVGLWKWRLSDDSRDNSKDRGS